MVFLIDSSSRDPKEEGEDMDRTAKYRRRVDGPPAWEIATTESPRADRGGGRRERRWRRGALWGDGGMRTTAAAVVLARAK